MLKLRKGGLIILNENLILNDFRKGTTIAQLTSSLCNSEKKEGIKLAQKDARARVEEVVLKDYLRAMRNQAV